MRRAAGADDNHMQQAVFDVAEFAGKTGDHRDLRQRHAAAGATSASIDIVQTDHPHRAARWRQSTTTARWRWPCSARACGKARRHAGDTVRCACLGVEARKAVGETLIGGITKTVTLAPRQGADRHVRRRLALPEHRPGRPRRQRRATTTPSAFPDAAAVAAYVARELPASAQRHQTLARHLVRLDPAALVPGPHLRQHLILATTTAHRFGTGRFWGWEGIGCCEGTCTHVWHYAQAVGRHLPRAGARTPASMSISASPSMRRPA